VQLEPPDGAFSQGHYGVVVRSDILRHEYGLCQVAEGVCVSLMKMSPLTAVLKCPHYEKGYFNNESERAAEVPSLKDGGRG